jgi:ribonuclease P protein component
MLNHPANSLKKTEILRGYGCFEKIIRNSLQIHTDIITAYIKVEKPILGYYNQNNKNYIKIGIIISKKLIKNSSKRNRIRRLIKEIYRNNKDKIPVPENFIMKILFRLKDSDEKVFSYNFLESQIFLLFNKMQGNIIQQ